jgi:hypothetical protein
MQHLAHFALMHLLYYEEQCDLGILVVWWAHRQGRGLRNTPPKADALGGYEKLSTVKNTPPFAPRRMPCCDVP